MRKIELTQGQVTLVDDDIYEELSRYKWFASWNAHTQSFYAKRSIRTPSASYISERMHRRIMSAPKSMLVDHISGDTLDNRRSNLRIVTIRENNQNIHCGKSSRYPGVCWQIDRKKWASKITINKKSYYLGLYETELDAFVVYLKACIKNGFAIDFLIKKFNITDLRIERDTLRLDEIE